MENLVLVLSRVVAVGFILLGVATVVSWTRHRDRTHGFMAGALGLLSVSILQGQVSSLTNYDAAWLGSIGTVAFLGSGYALVGLRDSFIPIGRVARRLVVIGLLLMIALTVVVLVTTDPRTAPGPLQWADFLLLLGAWCACVGEPAVRFWLASTGRPVVQRRRLRALSAGYLGIVAVLLISSVTGFKNVSVEIAAQVVSLCVIPLLYASFAPPRWLRRWWRLPEEEALGDATADLLLFASDRTVLAARGLDWAARLIGADGGAIIIDGEVVAAARGLDPATARALASKLRSVPSGEPLDVEDVDGRRAVLIRLHSDVADQALIVVGGPFTPLFGGDELDRLRRYAVYLASALERVRLVEALRTQTRHNEFLLDAASELGEGLVMTDSGRIIYANDAYVAITGYTFEELQQLPSLVDLVVPEEREEVAGRLRERLRNNQVASHYEATMLAKGNRRIVTENSVRLITEEGPGRIVAFVRDITERRRVEDATEAAARVDPVTRIPNRRAWDEELDRAIARAKRANHPLSVAMLDLDHFKSYNDDWGHQRGDRLLQDVAGYWLAGLREVDFLARYGGDEFAVILSDADLEGAQVLTERLSASTPGHQTISIGLASWDHQESVEDLVGRADAALLEVKRGGRNGIGLAPPHLPGDHFTSLRQRLVGIFADRDLVSAYQPILRLDGREIVGYEALARPAGDDAGASVEALFEAAKRLGYARDLDWLGRRAAFQNARAIPAGMALFVNVSVWALLDPLHDVDQMLMLLRWGGRLPSEVVLEISERDPISDFDRLREVLKSYRDEGFRFALDDVGEGHSTLEVMAAANAEFIKIARSLTISATNPGASSAIQAVVTFARASGATIVAEGIEDEETAAAMLAMGVELGQGYAFGRPQWMARPVPLDAEVAVA